MQRLLPLLFLAAVFGVTSALAQPDPPAEPAAPREKPKPEDVRERFYRCWLELERVEAGKRITDPEHLCGEEYTEDGYWGWGRRGELAAGPGERGVRIDPTTDPMRVEFLGGTHSAPLPKEPHANPGIFKFEGDKLIVVTGGWTKERPRGQDYPNRPKEFVSTKENGYTLSVYKPCNKYDQD
jgi:hypothetical protein